MKTSNKHVLLPALSSAGSFLCLSLLLLLTSPVRDVTYAVVFFIALLVFLVALGYLITSLQLGQVSRKSRGRIIVTSVFIVLLLMFRSTGSLSWIDGLVLLLIVAGLLFYGSHRA